MHQPQAFSKEQEEEEDSLLLAACGQQGLGTSKRLRRRFVCCHGSEAAFIECWLVGCHGDEDAFTEYWLLDCHGDGVFVTVVWVGFVVACTEDITSVGARDTHTHTLRSVYTKGASDLEARVKMGEAKG